MPGLTRLANSLFQLNERHVEGGFWRKRVGCRDYFELMNLFIGLILAFADMPSTAHMFSRRNAKAPWRRKVKARDDDVASSLPWGSIKRVSTNR